MDENEVTMESTFIDDLGADSLDVFQIINLGFGIAVQTEVVLNGNVVKADDAQTVKQKGKLRLYHDADKSFGVRGFLQQNKVEGAIDSRSRMKI